MKRPTLRAVKAQHTRLVRESANLQILIDRQRADLLVGHHAQSLRATLADIISISAQALAPQSEDASA